MPPQLLSLARIKRSLKCSLDTPVELVIHDRSEPVERSFTLPSRQACYWRKCRIKRLNLLRS